MAFTPLILYTDTYLTGAVADQYLNVYKCWSLKTDADKEAILKAISLMIDDLLYWGTEKVSGQPMKFPRVFNEFEDDIAESGDKAFTEEEQERRLRQAVIQWIIFSFTASGIGLQTYTVGDENVAPRLEVMPRETKSWLNDYWKG